MKLIKTYVRLGQGWEKSRVNVCLLSGIIVLIAYLLISLSHSYQLPECRAGGIIRTVDEQSVYEKTSFDDYQRLLSKRKLFGDSVKKAVVKPPSRRTSEMLRKLTLIGIISVDGKPQALIRDNQKRKDYYCRGGETIGNFKVERVLKDKVIMKSGDDELQLRL